MISRRAFLVNVSAGSLGLALFGRALAEEPSGELSGPRPDTTQPGVEAAVPGLNPNVFVHVGLDGLVTITCHRSEMGQGIRSSLPVLIADELGADMARVAVVQADGDAKYGDQNTDGSNSIRGIYEDMRRAGATARMMLIQAAAARWKVPAAECVAKDHKVTHTRARRSLGFGDLSADAARLPIPEEAAVVFRPDAELTHVGTDLPLLDAPAYVDGSAKFGADVSLPGMLVAVIARPPVVGGKLVRMDKEKALAVPGVRHVVEMPTPEKPYAFQPWGGVAVLADHTWAAMKGRAALGVEWEAGENADYSSGPYADRMRQALTKPGKALRNRGDTDAALASAVTVVEADYHVPHLPHVAMEPLVALARMDGDVCEIWAPTQHPQAAQAEVARLLGVGKKKVRVHVTFLGGGFGRKSKADFVGEAAYLAKQLGVPVRVQWTREDDIQHDYYNAVNTQRLTAGLDANGKVVAWRHRTCYPPIGSVFNATVDQPSLDDLQQGVLDLALDVPNVRGESVAAKAHTRIGWLRSVYNIFHAFAIGSFVDEIARARGADPRDVWLELIGPPRQLGLAELGVEKLANYGRSLEEHPVDAGRLRAVIERVTDASGWSSRGTRAMGLAAHRSFLSYTAAVASVVRDPLGRLRVDEVWLTIDAGKVINTDRVRAQMEGSVIFGLSLALHGAITMKGGAVEQSNFHDFKLLRIGEAPRRIHVDIVESDARPGGVGEPGVPPVAPAIANAIAALTGTRVRDLPIGKSLKV